MNQFKLIITRYIEITINSKHNDISYRYKQRIMSRSER